MDKDYLPSPIYSLLLLLLFTTSCNAQDKTNSLKENVSKATTNTDTKIKRTYPNTPEELQAFIDAGIDPYFVESPDTISTRGPHCITRDLLQDKHGNLWFATWMGIIKYDGKVFTNYTLKENLIQFHVFSCYGDRKGNLWFGTARGGMYRYDPSASLRNPGKSFTLFTTKDGLAGNTVTCFADDKAGNIWIGTDNGISRYDGKAFINYTTKDGLSTNNVSSIIEDKNGRIWVGCLATDYKSNDGGLCRFDPAAKAGEKLFTTFTNKDGFPYKSVVSLFEDKDENIWIGRYDGLTHYDGRTYTEFLPNSLSYYFTEDNKGTIWLSHSDPNTKYTDLPNQVLYRYDGKSFSKIIEKDEPGDFQIFGKTADAAGNIWFGTMNGPCRYDGKTFTYF